MAGLVTAFGSGAMTNSISEISGSKMLFVIGANPSEAHPVIAAKMRQARRKGAGLIVADPRKTELAAMADVWLQLKPGTRCTAERFDAHHPARWFAGSCFH